MTTSTNPSTAIAWDAAISFLDEDRPHAVAIADLLQGRANIFVYAHQQDHLIGRDGVLPFSDVFGRDAALVVILYREGWGNTGWTGIERDAINSRRVSAKSNEFLMVVKMDAADTPTWLPANRIYGNWDPLGAAGLAGAIVSRLQELGIEKRSETAVDIARRLERQAAWRNHRESFLQSTKARQAAHASWDAFRTAITALGRECQCDVFVFRDNACVMVSRRGISTTVAVSGSVNAPNLLVLQEWDEVPTMIGSSIAPSGEPISVTRLSFDLEPPDVCGWRLGVDLLPPPLLAESVIAGLLRRVERG